MKIVIPDDYQDIVDQLSCFALIRDHEVVRYREPARDLDELTARLSDADVVVSIRERVEFSRALLRSASRSRPASATRRWRPRSWRSRSS
jgi:D-3-phosphoglycerate dehydrogenase